MNKQDKIKNLYRAEIYDALFKGENEQAEQLLDQLKAELSDSYKKVVVYQ